MGFLRSTKDDEGCDVECRFCGRHLITGPCSYCGYVGEKCVGCEAKATEMEIMESEEDGKTTIDPVFMCRKCTDSAYEDQNEAANTP